MEKNTEQRNSTPRSTISPAAFVLDAFEDQMFHGYHEQQFWNEFACPLFPFEEAMRLLEINNATVFCGRLEYDPLGDVFRFTENENGENDTPTFPSTIRDGKALYPIGAFGWAWETQDAKLARFSADLLGELAEMKRIGMRVTEFAFKQATSREFCMEQEHMKVCDAASLLMELS